MNIMSRKEQKAADEASEIITLEAYWNLYAESTGIVYPAYFGVNLPTSYQN